MGVPLQPALNREYMLSLLERLLLTPSPSGYCMDIMKLLEEEALKLGYQIERTPKGNGIITLIGSHPARYPGSIGISAHVNTLGAMVRSIKPNGMIRFTIAAWTENGDKFPLRFIVPFLL
jgi:putative aminopeptidase FrvX